MNGRTFSPKPRKRGKRHHHHGLNVLGLCQVYGDTVNWVALHSGYLSSPTINSLNFRFIMIVLEPCKVGV